MRILIFFTAIIALTSVAGTAVNNELRDTLLEGVNEVGSAWYTMGNLIVFGEDVTSLVGGVGPSGGYQVAVAAAVDQNSGGKVLVYGNHLYGGELLYNKEEGGDTDIFHINAFNWLCEDENCRILVGTELTGRTATFLRENGFNNVSEFRGGNLKDFINDIDVLCIKFLRHLTEEDFALIPPFLEGGGSLIVFDGNNGFTQADQQSANKVLIPYGLAFAMEPESSPAGVLTKVSSRFNTSAEFLENTNVPDALATLKEIVENRGDLSPQILSTIMGVMKAMFKYIPHNEYFDAGKQVYEMLPRPSARDDFYNSTLNQTMINLEYELTGLFNGIGRSDVVQEHPAHLIFPGGVPGKIRIEGEVRIGYHKGWQSTGFYAPAGQLVTITVTEEFDDEQPTCNTRFGVHTDNIQRHSSWERLSRISITKEFSFEKGITVSLVSPYGGNIFIECPNAPDYTPNAPKASVLIQGVVSSATFVRGETDLTDWREAIRHRDAPWGELVDPGRIIFTHPKQVLANLDNPEELLQMWGGVIDTFFEIIGGHPPRAERVVNDIQISAGSAHSGYPTMYWWDGRDDLKEFVNATHFMEFGNWGVLHEIGHNFQRYLYNPPGVTEVTNNLLALYVCEKFLNVPRNEYGRMHEQVGDDKMIENIINYVNEGKDWNNSHLDWAKLGIFLQVLDKFGWDVYRNSFHKWRALETPPRNDAERQKLWIVSLSLESSWNLIPLFDSWGFPIPEDAEEEVSHLPRTSHTLETYLDELENRGEIKIHENVKSKEFKCGNEKY